MLKGVSPACSRPAQMLTCAIHEIAPADWRAADFPCALLIC